MSKPSYTGAKTYFLVLEVIAFAVFVLGCIVAVALYREAGHAPAIGAAVGSFVTFLTIIAVSQIGKATIHTAENTRRMADMMEADRKSRGRVNGSPPSIEAPEPEKLVARR